jgi:hypothetical protein
VGWGKKIDIGFKLGLKIYYNLGTGTGQLIEETSFGFDFKSARILHFLRDPDSDVMDPDPELDVNLNKIYI